MVSDSTHESDKLPELDQLNVSTRVVASGRPHRSPDAPVNVGIELSTTFVGPGANGYARSRNANWDALEEAISSIEGGQTLLFSSGMGAISAVFALLPKGSTILASQNGYTGTMSALKELEASGRADVRYVNISDTAAVVAQLPGVNFFWIESPTNPALEVADLPKIIAAAKSAGAGVGVDNTFATALIQQPLLLGADISMNSVTKYISGHSDILMGSLSVNDLALFERLTLIRTLGGAIPGPMETFLALRGMRTLAVRIEKSQRSALEIAQRLEQHPAVEKVRYPGLPTDPHHQTAASFMKGFGSIISFDVKGGEAAADKATSSSKLIAFATSLGGIESLWERRHRWPTESPNLPTNLVRLSVGIEDVEDLWRDIDQALNASQD